MKFYYSFDYRDSSELSVIYMARPKPGIEKYGLKILIGTLQKTKIVINFARNRAKTAFGGL